MNIPSLSSRQLGTSYPKGTVILRRGERPKYLYVIQQGVAEVVLETRYGEEQLSFPQKNDLIGTIAIFSNHPQYATVRALTDCRILKLGIQDAITRMHQDPSLAFRVVKSLADNVNTLFHSLTDALHAQHGERSQSLSLAEMTASAVEATSSEALKTVDFFSHVFAKDPSEPLTRKRILVPPKTVPVVTISRDYGSGGRKVGTILAKQLKTTLFDNQIRKNLQAHWHTNDAESLDHLDDKLQNALDDWFHVITSTDHISRDAYYRQLASTISKIADQGGVIMGRGAHLILDKRNIFRVKITGSLERCAHRICKRKGVSPKSAQKLVIHTNKERTNFVRSLYKRFPTKSTYYDLVISSDHLKLTHIVEIILLSMQRMGFEVSPFDPEIK
ncbi:cytidylate kinase family protein [Magnetococcales bacterium HHB-1]